MQLTALIPHGHIYMILFRSLWPANLKRCLDLKRRYLCVSLSHFWYFFFIVNFSVKD